MSSLDMTRAFFNTADMPHKHWPLAARHATRVKNRALSVALGGRTSYEMVYELLPDLGDVHMFGSKFSSCICPEEREFKLSNKTWIGRYVGLGNNNSVCSTLSESNKRVFHRGRTDVRQCLTSTAVCMSSIMDPVLDDGLFIDYFVQLPQPF